MCLQQAKFCSVFQQVKISGITIQIFITLNLKFKRTGNETINVSLKILFEKCSEQVEGTITSGGMEQCFNVPVNEIENDISKWLIFLKVNVKQQKVLKLEKSVQLANSVNIYLLTTLLNHFMKIVKHSVKDPFSLIIDNRQHSFILYYVNLSTLNFILFFFISYFYFLYDSFKIIEKTNAILRIYIYE